MAWSQWAKRFAGTSVLGLALATLGSSSCAEAEGRFFVECVSAECGCAEEQVVEGSFNAAGCGTTLAGEPMGVCGYGATFILRNQMISSLDFEANNNEVETSEIIVYSADISLESNGGATESVEGATVLGSIDPQGSLCASVTLLAGDAGVAEGDVVNVIASVKFYGRTTGGLEVETPTQYFPITIYNDPNDCVCGGDDNGGIDANKVACPNDC